MMDIPERGTVTEKIGHITVTGDQPHYFSLPSQSLLAEVLAAKHSLSASAVFTLLGWKVVGDNVFCGDRQLYVEIFESEPSEGWVKASDNFIPMPFAATYSLRDPEPAPAPTLAETMTTAGMTVKVKYNYGDEENYCQFLSNGNGTYTFQSGDGYAGGKRSPRQSPCS